MGKLLDTFVEERNLGVIVPEVAFVLHREPSVVRLPDLAFLRLDRVPPDDVDNEGQIEGPPDLAIEVRSPSERTADVQDKIDDYLEYDIKMVWVLDRPRQTLTVYRRGVPPEILGLEDTVDSYEILPGFSAKVDSLFPSPRR